MSRVLCRLGMHRWRTLRTDDDRLYRSCLRCRKDSGAMFDRSTVERAYWT